MCEEQVPDQGLVTGEMRLRNGQLVELASPGARLLARLVDTLLAFALASVVALGIHRLGVPGLFESPDIKDLRSLEGAVLGVVWSFYEIAGRRLYGHGSSAGKHLLRIRAVSARDGAAISLRAALNRWSILAGGLMVLLVTQGTSSPLTYFALVAVSAVSMLWSPTRQGWHDMAAGSVVIRVPAWTWRAVWERFRELRREDKELLLEVLRWIKRRFLQTLEPRPPGRR